MSESAAIYCRVSTEDQAIPDRPSLQQQEERCRAQCLAKEWDVCEVFIDITSGAKWERPRLQRLLEAAEHKQFSHVVFLAIDRLGRDLRDLLNIAEQLRASDVSIVSVKETFDTADASGRLFFQLLGAFAEFERNRINERMSAGRIGKVRQGKYLASKVPYGYKRSKDGTTLEIDEEQAKVVRDIFDWYTRGGLGMRAIANRLNELGVPSTRRATKHHDLNPWQYNAIDKILKSPRYIGRNTYSGVEMTCPAIIEELTFQTAQYMFQRNRTRSTGNTQRTYLLQHVLFCGVCGGKMRLKVKRNEMVAYCGTRDRYRELNTHNGEPWYHRVEKIEAVIKTIVESWGKRPSFIAGYMETVANKMDRKADEAMAEVAAIRSKLTELNDEEERLVKPATARI